MPSVNTKNMSFEKAMRIFRKKVENAGVKDRVRELEFYEKPTAKRKRLMAAAVKRAHKTNRKFSFSRQRSYR